MSKCATCRGEGSIGTGYSNSFVDASDAMPCPTCGGTGKSSRPSDPFLDAMVKIYGEQQLRASFQILRVLQGKHWVTQAKEVLAPEEMTTSHAVNTKQWLERRARAILIAAQIEASCAEADHNGGDMAHLSLEEEVLRLYEVRPLAFLKELPLYQAISERASAESDPEPTLALSVLRGRERAA